RCCGRQRGAGGGVAEEVAAVHAVAYGILAHARLLVPGGWAEAYPFGAARERSGSDPAPPGEERGAPTSPPPPPGPCRTRAAGAACATRGPPRSSARLRSRWIGAAPRDRG